MQEEFWAQNVALRHSYSDGVNEKEHIMETWVNESDLYLNPPARKSRKKQASAPPTEQPAYAPSLAILLTPGGRSEKRATDPISNIKEHLFVENREAFWRMCDRTARLYNLTEAKESS